jgi:hypothetical protein
MHKGVNEKKVVTNIINNNNINNYIINNPSIEINPKQVQPVSAPVK